MFKTVKALNYDVLIGNGIVRQIGSVISEKTRKVCIITDDNVEKLYYNIVEKLLKDKFEIYKYVIKSGEDSKCLESFCEIAEFLANKQMTRTDTVIALGGGVVGDLSGFAASCYMRGIDFIQMPTTLLAGIDSSIGGKTGVNLEGGKNLCGTFYQPKAVIFDIDFLRTLSESDVKNGMGEGIKYAVLEGGKLFKLLEDSDFVDSSFKIDVDSDDFLKFVNGCVKSKVKTVIKDEKESGARKLLNLGHTFAHAIEKESGYAVPHGQAVAIGLKIIIDMCLKTNRLNRMSYDRIVNLIKKFKMESNCDYKYDELLKYVAVDKKVSGKEISLITVEDIGSCKIERIPLEKVKEIFNV